jgi:hypothetical protein
MLVTLVKLESLQISANFNNADSFFFGFHGCGSIELFQFIYRILFYITPVEIKNKSRTWQKYQDFVKKLETIRVQFLNAMEESEPQR